MSSFWNFWRHYRVLSTTIPVGTMCKAKLQVAGILAMLLYHMFFIIVILPSSISRSRTRLSLWIDERQIASFFGKSILCICKNDNLSQFFFHIYIKNNDHRRKRCNMYISCSDLKKKQKCHLLSRSRRKLPPFVDFSVSWWNWFYGMFDRGAC